MKLETIKTFLYVAQEKNFSKVAERLYTTQSTVSRNIQELEKELECELYQRTNHGIELTPIGEIVEKHFLNIMNEWDKTVEDVNSLAAKKQPKLKIGYSFMGQLQYVVGKLSAINQTIDIDFKFAETQALLNQLRLGMLDCILIQRPSLGRNTEFNVEKIYGSMMEVVVSKKNVLAKMKSVKLIDLSHQTEIRTSHEMDYYAGQDLAYKIRGVALPKIKKLDDNTIPYEIVKLGDYVILKPDMYEISYDDELVTLPISDWPIDYDLVLVSLPNHNNHHVHEFYELIKE